MCLLVPRTDSIMYTHTLFYFIIIFIHTLSCLFFSFLLIINFLLFIILLSFFLLFLCICAFYLFIAKIITIDRIIFVFGSSSSCPSIFVCVVWWFYRFRVKKTFNSPLFDDLLDAKSYFECIAANLQNDLSLANDICQIRCSFILLFKLGSHHFFLEGRG